MDEWSGLENRRGFTPSVGSNPTPSASFHFGVLLMKFEGKVKGDLILVVVLILIGLGALLYYQVIVPKRQGPGTKVIVEIEGQVASEFDLSKDLKPLRFDTEHGYNVVEIKDGKVRISEADCPDLLCVNTGWRQHVGQVIVCLPHYFVVKVVGQKGNPADLDGFTY